MWRSQKVLNLDTEDTAQACYWNREEPVESRQVVYLSAHQFEEMGKPDSITVTIETGDRLN